MSLTKVQVAALVDELKSCLPGGSIDSLQASGPRSFIIRLPKASLLLCLQEPFLRFHLSSQPLKGYDSPFSQSLSTKLKGAVISSIAQLNEDRILELSLQTGSQCYRLIVEFFPKRPNIYLLEKDQILLTLKPVSQSHYALPSQPAQSSPIPESPLLTNVEIERHYADLESAAELQSAKHQLEQRLKQRLKRLKKSQTKLQEELQAGLRWEERQHEADLLKANFPRLKRGLHQIEVTDWEDPEQTCLLTLDPILDPQQQLTLRFKQAKKLRLSIEPLQKQLQRLLTQLTAVEQELKLLSQATTLEEVDKLQETAPLPVPRTVQERALPYREFFTASGLSIWVGKEAKSNETLTFSLARGSDYWLHVHDCPGAHVILRIGKASQDPDPESLQDAIQVALAYSSAKERGEAEICVTQRKFVSRIKRAKAGQVQVSKHKLLHARFDPERFRAIKERGQR